MLLSSFSRQDDAISSSRDGQNIVCVSRKDRPSLALTVQLTSHSYSHSALANAKRKTQATMPPKSSYSSVHPPSTKSHHPSTAPNDAHDILAALDVVEALDTMPMELTKTFGDLRELDAVLNGESERK